MMGASPRNINLCRSPAGVGVANFSHWHHPTLFVTERRIRHNEQSDAGRRRLAHWQDARSSYSGVFAVCRLLRAAVGYKSLIYRKGGHTLIIWIRALYFLAGSIRAIGKHAPNIANPCVRRVLINIAAPFHGEGITDAPPGRAPCISRTISSAPARDMRN